MTAWKDRVTAELLNASVRVRSLANAAELRDFVRVGDCGVVSHVAFTSRGHVVLSLHGFGVALNLTDDRIDVLTRTGSFVPYMVPWPDEAEAS